MRLGSALFFLWFLPFVLLRFFMPDRFKRPQWAWLLFISLIYLFFHGVRESLYVLFCTTSVFYISRRIQGNSKLYILTIAFFVCIWALAKSTMSMSLSPSYVMFFLLACLTERYWGRLKAPESLAEFTAGAASLSWINAGPVPHPREHLAMIRNKFDFSPLIFREASLRIFLGLFKKGVADSILHWTIIMNTSQSSPMALSWTKELLRAARLYCDFAGYADIAIGVGLILGHRLPEDFRFPFFATSVSGYWRSWNSSVTTFFIIYVFNPLNLRLRSLAGLPLSGLWLPVALSTYITLILSGVWHGFTLSQLTWGLFVGTLILIEHYSRLPIVLAKFKGGVIVSWALTFYLMMIARVFSTQTSFAAAWLIIERMHSGVKFLRMRHELLGLSLAILAVSVPHSIDYLCLRKVDVVSSVWRWMFVLFILMCTVWLFRDYGTAFIYEGY